MKTYIHYLLSLFLLASVQVLGQNMIYTETFADCEIPQGWETMVEYGGADWVIESTTIQNPDYGDKCVLYFLDTNRPGKGDSSSIVAYSPWVQPLNGDEFFIDYQVNFVKQSGDPQYLEVYYEQGSNLILHERYDSATWGATFNDFADRTITIDNATNEPVRVVIKFNNQGEQNSVVTMDNFVFRGYNNDICDEAVSVDLTGGRCYEGNNYGQYDGMLHASCQGIQTSRPTWFQFVAPRNGFVKVKSSSDFNDVIDVYYGLCNNLTPFRCSNRDEYGFDGEEMYFNITEGIIYYIRVSGYNEPYSKYIGSYCLEIEEIPSLPQSESYDFCNGALAIQLDSPCVEAHNRLAGMDGPLPTLNLKSKADIWFKYTHQTDQKVSFFTNANFSDVITIYTGNCLFPQEVTGTDQGPNFENVQLQEGLEYYIQVSGYFSQLEGDLCMEVQVSEAEPPVNDDCVDAISIDVGSGECEVASNLFSESSGQKSSCQIKAGSDIWFSFTPPASGNVALEVSADFIYDLALYTGSCDSLIEQRCGYNPHRCEGYVYWENLDPGQTHYLQLSSHVNSFGEIRGEVCVKVFETGSEPEFQQLTLNVELECLGGQVGILRVQNQGGSGQLTSYGNKDGDIILFGQSYEVTLDDETGCRVFAQGVSACSDPIDCSSSDLDLVVTYDCEMDKFGLPTGRSVVSVTTTGGNGQVDLYGDLDGSLVEGGALIRVIAVDEGGCLKMFEALNDCEAWTCDDSEMEITVNYSCIDSLLRAELNVTAENGNGMYTFSGNVTGDLLETGESFVAYVTDETGCIDSISGIIDCEFDSCVYSGLAMEVDFDCVTDQMGRQTGEAILRINTTGGVGNLNITGGQDGDTLYNGDMFEIVITDDWGCEQIQQGVVMCAPTSNEDLVSGPISRVYPNPTDHWVMLEYEGTTGSDLSVEIISESGQVSWFMETSIVEGVNTIPLIFGELSSGVYMLRTREGERIGVQRLVILD